MYVNRDHEWLTTQVVCKSLEAYETSPVNTCVAIVSPDYSASIGMHVAHHLSNEGEMLDMLYIDVPYPDEAPDYYRDKFLDPNNPNGIVSFYKYDKVVLVEAGIITGGNYTFLEKVFNLHKIDLITVAQYENVHSKFQSDVVGEYYDSEVAELEFYWERYNKHWD
jgi:hypothetical protein